MMNWSGGFQYQITNTWLAELLYQGSAGVGLLNNWDINVVPLNVSTDPDHAEPDSHRLSELQAISAVRRHPALLELRSQHPSRGDPASREAVFARRNSELILDLVQNAQRRGRGRRRRGITWYNRGLEKGRAGYDISHRWVTTVTYELPVGKGQAIHELGRMEKRDLRRLGIGGIQHFMTGPPLTITFSGSPNVYLPGAIRPNQLKPNDEVKMDHVDIGPNRFPFSAQNRYFDYTGFAYPASFQAGTLGRNTLQASGVVWAADIAIERVADLGALPGQSAV